MQELRSNDPTWPEKFRLCRATDVLNAFRELENWIICTTSQMPPSASLPHTYLRSTFCEVYFFQSIFEATAMPLECATMHVIQSASCQIMQNLLF